LVVLEDDVDVLVRKSFSDGLVDGFKVLEFAVFIADGVINLGELVDLFGKHLVSCL